MINEKSTLPFPMPFMLQTWIEDNRHLLKPPVGNKVLWQNTQFIVMIVGGPNSRTDFHVNQSEEFFYQLEGDIFLKTVFQGKFKDIPIKAGEVFLLPPNTPHSPQRATDSVGLVIEKKRIPGEIDTLQWYCEKCVSKLYEESFYLTNIETQFPEVFERYYNSDHINCKNCHYKNGRSWTLI